MKDMACSSVETKTEKSERLKREKNPWEALEEIRSFARTGRSTVPHEWAAIYFKWWGVYTQSDGKGALGEVSPYFMHRVGLPNGFVTSKQLKVIGALAKQHARNRVAITVRQSLQFHWVNLESIPVILDALLSVGLTSKGTSGDVLRGVTGCPLAGFLPSELTDASSLVTEIARTFSANSEFYNLPRKLKVSVTGCPMWCSHPELNDLGLTAVKRGDEIGFSLRVGGGLARSPHLAVRLNAFIRQSQVIDTVRAIMTLFREQESLRQKREQARLRHLFLKQGWTPEHFLSEVETILGYKLDPSVDEVIPETAQREHLGIHPQKQSGLDFVGVAVPGGELSGSQLLELARLAEYYGSGDIRFSVGQNLVIPNVLRSASYELAKALESIDLAVESSPFRRGIVSCTGPIFCKMGIAETKLFSSQLIAELERRLPNFADSLKINVTGCGNGCAHHHVSDIGLEGRKIKQDGKMIDGFSFRIGGALGKEAGLARTIGYQCPAQDVSPAIERLLRGYADAHREGEDLHAFLARSTDEEVRRFLTGQAQRSPAASTV